jgi:hypothetical protein
MTATIYRAVGNHTVRFQSNVHTCVILINFNVSTTNRGAIIGLLQTVKTVENDLFFGGLLYDAVSI